MKPMRCALISLLVLFTVVGAIHGVDKKDKKLPTSQSQPQPPPMTAMTRPDLVVEKIEFTNEGTQGDGIRVRIAATVANKSAVSSSCCPTSTGKAAWQANPVTNLTFQIRFESRAYPTGKFTQAGGLIGTIHQPWQTGKYTHVEIVPKGTAREFRVTADYGNWIFETSETNNQKQATWGKVALRKEMVPIEKKD
jgi:hypothetical protein